MNKFMQAAIEKAIKGLKENVIPIGSVGELKSKYYRSLPASVNYAFVTYN